MRTLALPSLLILAVLLAGCAAQNVATPTPSVTDPPEVTVDRYCQLGAHSAALASSELIVLYKAGKVSPDTFGQIRTYIETADSVFRNVSAETQSGDAWTVMRVKILAIAGTAAIASAVPDPQLQADLNAISGMVQSILGVQ
jgi:hypothetical protein